LLQTIVRLGEPKGLELLESVRKDKNWTQSEKVEIQDSIEKTKEAIKKYRQSCRSPR
jgi:hypothetical protein